MNDVLSGMRKSKGVNFRPGCPPTGGTKRRGHAAFKTVYADTLGTRSCLTCWSKNIARRGYIWPIDQRT